MLFIFTDLALLSKFTSFMFMNLETYVRKLIQRRNFFFCTFAFKEHPVIEFIHDLGYDLLLCKFTVFLRIFKF